MSTAHVIYDNDGKFNFLVRSSHDEAAFKNYLQDGRVYIHNPKYRGGTKIIKKQNTLVFWDTHPKFTIKIKNMFQKDYAYWSEHFLDFSKENYPEYFV